MGDVDSTATSGVEVRGYRRGTLSTDPWDQYVVPTFPGIVSYLGRAATFRIPGNLAVTQNLASIHNATGSTVLVDVTRVRVDLTATVAKAITVQQPVLRLYRVTVLPTAGTAITKTPMDTQALGAAAASSASVTLLQGASAHRTASALTATLPANNVLSQIQASRVITAAGVDIHDPVVFFDSEPDVTLRPLEGLVVVAEDAVVTTGNPAGDWYTVVFEWKEYTRP